MKKLVTLVYCSLCLFAYSASVNMLSCCPGEDSSTQARFVWHSDSNACTFWYAKASAPGDAVQATCESVYKPITFRSSDVSYYKYTAALSSLDPGTEYIYYVKSGSTQSATQRFKTAGTSGSYNFLWLSDVHSHPDDSGKMTTVEFLRHVAETNTASSGGIDMVLFSGDAVKYGSRYDNWQQWNGSPAVTNYTFAMVPGNKEYYYTGSSTFYDYYWYLAVKNNPPNGPGTTEQEGCYWFIRDSVLFVGIDSLIHKGSRMTMYNQKSQVLAAQTNWFDRVVTSQSGKFRYLVVVQHDPWFVCSSDGFDKSRGNYDVWRHVFDKHKVDLALSGDEHNYIRSKPLRGDSANSDGTVYMVAGQIEEENYSATVTTDVASYGNSNATKYFACMGTSNASCGAAWIEVRPTSLKVTEFWDKYQSPGYKQYDSFEITPKDRGFVYVDGAGVEATPHARYRFKVDAPRSDGYCMQLSEIQLLDASGSTIPSSSFTIAYDSTTTDSYGDTFPDGETPENAVDGSTSTKWLDWRAGLDQSAKTRSVVWLDFCFDSPTAVYGYRWYTANDALERSPVSWTFSASDDDGATWTVLDKVVDYNTTTEYKALAYKKILVASGGDEPQPPTTVGGTYYALCVGLNKYSYVGPNLDGCVTDAKNVLSACTNAAKGVWSPANCHILTDSGATLSAVRAQFQALASQAASGDTVLYYHSSHGGVDELCTYNKDYTASDFASDLLRFKTGVRVVVLIDACHSASMFKGTDGESSAQGPWNFAASVEAHMAEIKKERAAKGYKADNSPSVGWITACDENELSIDWGSYYGGKFTYNFVNAWKSASTDANGDGFNDFLEIFDVAAPLATDMPDGNDEDDVGRVPQKLNDDVLAGVAAWELYEHLPDSYVWTGLGGDGDFSNGANWQDGESPVAGASLDFTRLTTNATLNVDVANAAFGKLVMGNAVVTFTGSISASEITDTSKIAVGENATVTLNGDLIYTETAGGGWMLNRLDGVFVVTGKIVVSGSADMKLAQSIGANGVAVVKGLVSNNSGTPWTFRLNRSNSGDTARWVIGEEGLSGSRGFWMYAASSSSSAIIQPNANDVVIADWIGVREGPSLTINTTGWADNAGHVITATAGFIREGNMSVTGTGMLVCDYDASSGAYDQSAHSVAFNVGGSATLALAAGSNIGTGGVTVNGGAALALTGAGTATIGGSLSLQSGSSLVVGGAALNVASISLPASGTVNVSFSSELGVGASTTILSITGDQTLADGDLAKFSTPDGYILSLGNGGKYVVATRYSGMWTGGMALTVPADGVSIGSAAFDVSGASQENPIFVTIDDGGTLAANSDSMVLSAATVPQANPAEYMTLVNGVPPGYAAVFHAESSAEGTAIYVNVVPVKWVEESVERQHVTGSWSSPVVYVDGKAFFDGDVGGITFTPYTASTGTVVTVETTAQFHEDARDDYTPGQDVQVAVRLSTNGCFQVWTMEQSGVASGGVGELRWVDVDADGVTPESGAEYTLRTTLNYTAGTYGVEVKTGLTEFTRFRERANPVNPANPVKNSFPLAFSTNCVSCVGFVGDTYFTSLSGDCRYEIVGFVADEALALSNNVERVLSAAEALWLNKCGGDKATVRSAAAGLSADEFADAYLLNLDITDGGRSYSFEVTDIDVGDKSVTVAVTLRRSGEIDQAINGTLKFYGAATLEAFKSATEPLGSAVLYDDDFSEGNTATATIPLEGETPPAFFKARIEKRKGM